MTQHGRSEPAELLKRSWADEVFRTRLEKDPKSVLAEMGHPVPDDIEVRVVMDTDRVKHIHIPADPNVVLSDDELEAVAGGGVNRTMGSWRP